MHAYIYIYIYIHIYNQLTETDSPHRDLHGRYISSSQLLLVTHYNHISAIMLTSHDFLYMHTIRLQLQIKDAGFSKRSKIIIYIAIYIRIFIFSCTVKQ